MLKFSSTEKGTKMDKAKFMKFSMLSFGGPIMDGGGGEILGRQIGVNIARSRERNLLSILPNLLHESSHFFFYTIQLCTLQMTVSNF